jgi:hypothetical protein
MRNLILTAAWLSGLLWAQTILVDGTGDGSFEGGTGCAGNGYIVNDWTIVNGNQTNRWAVNTGAGATHGSRAIYITNNCGSTPPSTCVQYRIILRRTLLSGYHGASGRAVLDD